MDTRDSRPFRSASRLFVSRLAVIFVVGLAAAAPAAFAQGGPGFHIGVSGGVDFPVENQSNIYETGWNGTLMFVWNFGDSPFGIRLDGSYHSMDVKDELVGFLPDGSVRVLDGTFDFVIGPHIGTYVQPYIIGGVGGYDLRFEGQEFDEPDPFSDSTTRFGWNAGTGIAFRLGDTTNAHLFIEGRYSSISTDGDRFTNSIHTGGSRFTIVSVNTGIVF